MLKLNSVAVYERYKSPSPLLPSRKRLCRNRQVNRLIMEMNVLLKYVLCGVFMVSCTAGARTDAGGGEKMVDTGSQNQSEVFVFDGFSSVRLGKGESLSALKPPVTTGRFFVLFFVREGYLPVVRVLKADRETLNAGKADFAAKIHGADGFLSGVVYKPVRGGKVSYSKGIAGLFSDIEVRAVSGSGQIYTARTGDSGVFGMSLPPGSYKVMLEGTGNVAQVTINTGRTTLHNIQKGLVLLD